AEQVGSGRRGGARPPELRPAAPPRAKPPVTIEVRTADQPVLVETADGRVRVRPGTATAPDAVVSGQPPLVASLLIGRIDLETARARGLEFEGDPDALRRVQPAALPASARGVDVSPLRETIGYPADVSARRVIR